jgi:hypothetical protein
LFFQLKRPNLPPKTREAESKRRKKAGKGEGTNATTRSKITPSTRRQN